MDDSELERIKASRMAQLQTQQQGAPANSEQQKQLAEQQELMKNSILKQVLEQEAFARLSNIAAVNATKANAVENLIVRMARSGQLHGKLSDDGLKDLLNQVAAQQKGTTVKFDRRRAALDSDDDDY